MRAVQRYKKAAKALRTFEKQMETDSRFSYGKHGPTSEDGKKVRSDFHARINQMRKDLDETLGSQSLSYLYHEGKEF